VKTISANKVRSVLRRKFNLKPRSHGNGTGREVWMDSNGRTCSALLRKKDVSFASLFCLSREMESKGITNHRVFMREVRG